MDRNIEMDIRKIPFTGSIELVTYYSKGCEYYLQKNSNNKFIKKITLFKHSDQLINIDSFPDGIKIINYNDNLTFQHIFDYCNTNLANNIICLMKPGFFLEENELLWELDKKLNNKVIFCITRREMDQSGNYWRNKELSDLACAISQDAWLFKSPLDIKGGCMVEIRKKNSDIILAAKLKESGCFPINDSENYKIVHYQGQEIEGENFGEIENEKYRFLPDLTSMKNLSLDSLVANLQLNPLDIYYIKSDILTRYLT